jgi:hypothetical protein
VCLRPAVLRCACNMMAFPLVVTAVYFGLVINSTLQLGSKSEDSHSCTLPPLLMCCRSSC